MCVTCFMHMCDMTHSHVWHDTCVSHRELSVIYSYVWCDPSVVSHLFICVMWWDTHVWHLIESCQSFIHMCDVTHSHVWRASCTCVTWDIHTCDWSYLYMICLTFMLESRHSLNSRRDVPHSHVWHASFTRVTCLMHMCDMRHSHVWLILFIYDMRDMHVSESSFMRKSSFTLNSRRDVVVIH